MVCEVELRRQTLELLQCDLGAMHPRDHVLAATPGATHAGRLAVVPFLPEEGVAMLLEEICAWVDWPGILSLGSATVAFRAWLELHLWFSVSSVS